MFKKMIFLSSLVVSLATFSGLTAGYTPIVEGHVSHLINDFDEPFFMIDDSTLWSIIDPQKVTGEGCDLFDAIEVEGALLSWNEGDEVIVYSDDAQGHFSTLLNHYHVVNMTNGEEAFVYPFTHLSFTTIASYNFDDNGCIITLIDGTAVTVFDGDDMAYFKDEDPEFIEWFSENIALFCSVGDHIVYGRFSKVNDSSEFSYSYSFEINLTKRFVFSLEAS